MGLGRIVFSYSSLIESSALSLFPINILPPWIVVIPRKTCTTAQYSVSSLLLYFSPVQWWSELGTGKRFYSQAYCLQIFVQEQIQSFRYIQQLKNNDSDQQVYEITSLTLSLAEAKFTILTQVDHLWPHGKSPHIVYLTKLDFPHRGA